MKILAIKSARVIWIIPTNYINPKGRNLNSAVEKMRERYSFVNITPPEQLYGANKVNPNFEGGEFISKNGNPIEVSLTIHTDGLVADSRLSTNATEEFLVDIITWLSNEFGTVPADELAIRKLYVSEFYFAFDRTPKFFSPEVETLAKNASELIEDGKVGSYEFSGIVLGTDPGKSKNPLTFRIEREFDTAFNENRYYSAAPLETSEHIKLVENFEKLF